MSRDIPDSVDPTQPGLPTIAVAPDPHPTPDEDPDARPYKEAKKP